MEVDFELPEDYDVAVTELICAVVTAHADEFVVCPYCNGQSTPRAVLDYQLSQNGDTSGACSTCDNTQVVRRRSVNEVATKAADSERDSERNRDSVKSRSV